MKKIFLALMSALLGCGMAWAGVKVTGTVTVPGEIASFCNGGIVTLSNDENLFVASIGQFGNSDSYGYEFSSVPEGTYTLSGRTQDFTTKNFYEGETTITVSGSSGTQKENLELSLQEGTYYEVVIAALPPETGWTQIAGARISFENKSTGKIDKRETKANTDYSSFFCKAGVEYEIVIKANGYKTYKETRTFTYDCTGPSQLKIRLEEGQDETEKGNAALTGTVTMVGGGEWPSGVYIALVDASNELIDALSSLSEEGTYTFPNVKLGSSVSFHLTTNLINPTSHPSDYTFVEGGSDVNPVPFTVPATVGTEAVVTKNLTVKYTGNAPATLVGRALNAEGECLSGVGVTLGNKSTTTKSNINDASKYGFDCSNIFALTNVAAGEHTINYAGKDFYGPTSQTYTVVVTGPNQTIKLPDVTLPSKQETVNFNGVLAYQDAEAETPTSIPVAGATITAYDSEEGGNVLGTATTAADGTWSIQRTCSLKDVVYFYASHPNITVAKRATSTVTLISQYVNINFDYVTEKVTLALERNNSAWGTVEGARDYEKGTSATAKANPATNYKFVEWKEGETQVSTDNPYTFTINEDRTLTAVFAEIEKVTLTLEANNTAWGSVDGTGEYYKGSNATANASPVTGYKFVAWKDGETQVSTDNPYTFKIEEARTLTAVFAEIEKVTLALEANNPAWGSVSGMGEFDEGTSVSAKATPAANYKFMAWKEGEAQVSTDNPYTFTITANRSLQAVFAPDSALLTVKPNNPALGSVSGGGKFAKGQSVTVSASPAEGCEFHGWRNNAGTTESEENPYTFTFTGALTLTAYFTSPDVVPDSATLTLTVNNAAMGTASARGIAGGAKFEAGETVAITATPQKGYKFVEWQENGTQLSIENPYEVEIVANTDRSIMAVFAERPSSEKDSFNLTLQVNHADMGTVEGTGRYEEGTPVTIKAIAKEGYVFEAWKTQDGATEISKEAEYRITLVSDSTLKAYFAVAPIPVKDSFNLTLLIADSTMGTVEGTGRYEKGEEITVKAIANEGYEFRAWLEGDEVVAMEAEYPLVVEADRTLTAVFAAKSNPNPGPGTANEDAELAAWSVYAQDGQIVLRGNAACQYDVYNMAGILVKRAYTSADEYRMAVDNSGMYIVRRISATGISVKKVMVR